MKLHALPDWPGFITHTELEFINARRCIQRLHAVENAAHARPLHQLLCHPKTQRVRSVIAQIVRVALLIHHVVPVIKTKYDDGCSQLPLGFGSPDFESRRSEIALYVRFQSFSDS